MTTMPPQELPAYADWTACKAHDHLVQFYEDDAFLADAISGFVATALGKGEGAVVIATASHRAKVEEELAARGLDVAGVAANGQYVALDAADTLSRFMVDDWPDKHRFREVVGTLISTVSARYPQVNAFGEMGAVLWAEEKNAAAIELEKLWNELARLQSFSLCCAYPLNGFARHGHSKSFLEVCALHTHVLPAERGLSLADADSR